jgi:DNA-binding protein YbaB
VQPSGVVDRMRQIQEAVAQASVELVSDDHSVTVVVGPSGAVRDLTLNSWAFRHTGAELGEIIVATLKAANAQMREELSATLAEITGSPLAASGSLFSSLPTPARLCAELDGQPGEGR